jgi:hypothetical protein
VWLASITALWILTWAHPWSMVVPSIATFAMACAATLVFGGELARRGHERLIPRAAFGGILVLGIASIVAFGVSAVATSGGGVGGFFGAALAVMVFGSIVILALGVVGLWLLLLLLMGGAKLSSSRRTGR